MTSIVCAIFVFLLCIPTLLLHNIYVYSTAIEPNLNASATLSTGGFPIPPDHDAVVPREVPSIASFSGIQLSTTTVKAPVSSLPKADALYYTMDIDRESCTFFKFNLWLNAIVLKVSNGKH